MKNIRKILNRTLEFLAGISFIGMTVLVSWQVLARYIFKNPSSWTEELVSYLFAWTTLMGASIVLGERNHMSIPVIIEKFPLKLQKICAIFTEITVIIFSASIFIYGGTYISNLTMGQLTSSLKVPIGFFYSIVPLCGVLNIIYSLLNIYDIRKNNISVLIKEEEA